MDNSMVMAEIKSTYNHSPYYKSGEYISINDDRIGRVVSFKIYEYYEQLFVDFAETSQISSLNNNNRSRTKTIYSYDDFQKKYYDFYNDLNS